MAQTYNNSYQTEKNKKKSESMLSLLFPLQRQWCSLEDTTNTTAEKENCTRMYVRFDEFLYVGFSSLHRVLPCPFNGPIFFFGFSKFLNMGQKAKFGTQMSFFV